MDEKKENAADQLRASLYGEVMSFMRQRHPEMIDAAYEFFWEEEYPEDFLSGLPLELGFMNFEDWFICDYGIPGHGPVTDLFLKETGQTEDREKPAALGALKDSFISLYEVRSAGDGGAELDDILLGKSHSLKTVPVRGLQAGGIFATRIIRISGLEIMGACVYPFMASMKQAVLGSIEGQFGRFKKNKDPNGSMGDFLKQESYIFNVIWTSSLYKRS